MSERTYTEEEVARLQESEVRVVLKGLLRNLEGVHRQRTVSRDHAVTQAARDIAVGQIDGLDTAMRAIRRRIR